MKRKSNNCDTERIFLHRSRFVFCLGTLLLFHVLLISLCFPLSGCEKDNGFKNAVFSVWGDVENPAIFNGSENLSWLNDSDYEREAKSVSLSEILKICNPDGEIDFIAFEALDGRESRVANNFEECRLYSTENYGWRLRSEKLPESAWVKYVQRIIVVCKDPLRTVTFKTDNGEEIFSCGDFLSNSRTLFKIYEGKPGIVVNDEHVYSEIYTLRKGILVSEIAGSVPESFTAKDISGNEYRISGDCILEAFENSFKLVSAESSFSDISNIKEVDLR